MIGRNCIIRTVAWVALVVAATVPANAESVAKKWRLSFDIGSFTPRDQVRSDAANVLTLFSRDTFELEQQFVDPRNDSAVFGTLEVRPSGFGNFAAQYAVNNIFIIEGSIGYARTELGKVEIQAEFDNIPIDEDFGFNFQTYRIDAGELDIVPLQLTALARFRPRAAFNPYVGAGIGYSFLGYEPTEEFNQLSLNMDSSLGRQSFLSGSIQGNPDLVALPGQPRDLQGATVDVSDTFTYHVVLGAEYTFKPRWALMLDMRYGWSSREVSVGFNGGEDLGKSVPFLTDFTDSPVASETFGAVKIDVGGLIDGGSLQPLPGQDGANCAAQPSRCFFDVTQPDGELDTGFYYVNGGSVDLEAFTIAIGVRYTFK